jgi:hypothetical protein
LTNLAARRSHNWSTSNCCPRPPACVSSYQIAWCEQESSTVTPKRSAGHWRYGCPATKYKHGKGDGFCMLAKCANPSCSASFRNLQEGRLFRLETDPESNSDANSDASRQSRVEYFWLCGPCSEFMALRLGQDGTVVTVSLPDSVRRAPEDFAIISRHKHKLLRSVTFARKRGEGRSEPRSARNLRS